MSTPLHPRRNLPVPRPNLRKQRRNFKPKVLGLKGLGADVRLFGDSEGKERAMKIVCLGGGPAGLYFAISVKLRQPEAEVTVLERNRADDTFGWGVVLSDETLDNLEKNDSKSAGLIREDAPLPQS